MKYRDLSPDTSEYFSGRYFEEYISGVIINHVVVILFSVICLQIGSCAVSALKCMEYL